MLIESIFYKRGFILDIYVGFYKIFNEKVILFNKLFVFYLYILE